MANNKISKLTKTFFYILIIICMLNIFSCDSQEPTLPQPLTFDGVIIAVGDSLTAGLGVAAHNSWPNILEKKLHTDGKNWQVINAGISGETSSGTLARIKWVITRKPDVVIIETGANDGFRGIPITVIQNNISESVQLLQQNKIQVVLAGMQIVENLGPDYTKDFSEIYKRTALEEKCIFIPFLLQNVAGEPSLNQNDTIHPNEHGHKIIAENVFPFILKAIENSNKETL